MKTIKDYIGENGSFVECIGNRDFGFSLVDDYIIVEVDNGEIHELKDKYDIQDMLYDNYDVEVRFCDECGKPFDAGFMAGDGEYYCCEECFEPMMNREYGKDKWRATKEEGRYGGYYEYLDRDKWHDTGWFYTEWY